MLVGNTLEKLILNVYNSYSKLSGVLSIKYYIKKCHLFIKFIGVTSIYI